MVKQCKTRSDCILRILRCNVNILSSKGLECNVLQLSPATGNVHHVATSTSRGLDAGLPYIYIYIHILGPKPY